MAYVVPGKKTVVVTVLAGGGDGVGYPDGGGATDAEPLLAGGDGLGYPDGGGTTDAGELLAAQEGCGRL